MEVINETITESTRAIFVEHVMGPSAVDLGENGFDFADRNPGFQYLVKTYYEAIAYALLTLDSEGRNGFLIPIQKNIEESMKIVRELAE
ncbi:hypothetical protein OAE25_02330 [Verrucomicrobiales bacterium]|nr:hypothetical protein [Verrucomicrobiales bacterium]